MYIAMLGRQPELGIAELERVYGDVRWFAHDSALVDSDTFDVQRLGGTIKAGVVVRELTGTDWRKTSMELVKIYHRKWSDAPGKITLGISAHGFTITAKDVGRTAHILKSKLKDSGVSVRMVPNEQPALSSASSHHNKLGLSNNKVELMVVRGHGGKVIIAESTGAQNITALANRDQARPARDAFVGMLPPKLALIMTNLAVGKLQPKGDESHLTILDPFCGTGVILQEAALLMYSVYGTDVSEKMIRYSRDNIQWLEEKYKIRAGWYLHEGDAVETIWRQPIDAVATEAYLGQPFSAPPSPSKLAEVKQTCDTIISKFLKNMSHQIQSGTPLCIAVPAWSNRDGTTFTRLNLVKKLDSLGYRPVEFKNIAAKDLLYYRPGQVVARDLLVIERI